MPVLGKPMVTCEATSVLVMTIASNLRLGKGLEEPLLMCVAWLDTEHSSFITRNCLCFHDHGAIRAAIRTSLMCARTCHEGSSLYHKMSYTSFFKAPLRRSSLVPWFTGDQIV